MPGSTTYRGNTGPFNNRVQLERDREAARKAAEEQLAEAMREASGIVTPPVRRRREGGQVTPAAPVIVGERGPETLIPDTSGRIGPATETASSTETTAEQES
jgi:hypothetical protein